jgi:hypothetical protein
LGIRAFDENFDIIHKNKVSEEYSVLQCQIPGKTEDYTVLHFERAETVKRLLPLFYSLQENVEFEDYRGCFSREEELYIVFRKRQGISLAEQLAGSRLSLEQRIRIGKQVLEKLLLWRLPDFMLCQLLDESRILIQDESVGFAYDWDLSMGEHCSMTMVNKRMAGLLRALFQEEAEHAASPRLMKLLDDLEQDIPEDFFAIYEAYSSLYDVMPEEAGRYVSGFQKIKRDLSLLVKKGQRPMKIILFLAVYAAVVLWLLQEIKQQEVRENKTEGIVYETIGALRIK